VAVQVSYDPAQVHVSVRNTHSAGYPASPLAGTGSGLGLANLRQRIELVHGTLLAGPGPDGGFQVEATLPAYVPTLDAVAADAPAAAAPAAEPVV
jgi:signal transduction histidine kinase